MQRLVRSFLVVGAALWALPAYATTDFDTFITGRSPVTQPLGSSDKFPVVQGGVTKYLQATQVQTLNDPQIVTNHTISGSNNTLTVRLGAGQDVTGTLTLPNGGLGFSSATSGGVVCATSSSVLTTSAALTANLPVIGGGAGVCPAVGSTSGNTTKFASVSGSFTSAVGFVADANGNIVSSARAALLDIPQTWTATQTFGSVIGGQNNQTTGSAYTLAATDCGKTIYVTTSTAFTITTLNSLPVGCTIALEQGGAGQVTVASGAGSSLNSSHGYSHTFGQYAIIGLYVDTNSGGAAAHIILTGDGA